MSWLYTNLSIVENDVGSNETGVAIILGSVFLPFL